MGARRIRVQVDDVTATAALLEALSPKTTEAFWQALPIETTLTHTKWSGQACCFHPGEGPLSGIDSLESPVCSIYPGYLVARPRGSELLIAYGPAEYRWHLGTDYVTRVAEVVENAAELRRVLARMHDEGDKRIGITRVD
jgi:uncharacterized protein DUF3830